MFIKWCRQCWTKEVARAPERALRRDHWWLMWCWRTMAQTLAPRGYRRTWSLRRKDKPTEKRYEDTLRACNKSVNICARAYYAVYLTIQSRPRIYSFKNGVDAMIYNETDQAANPNRILISKLAVVVYLNCRNAKQHWRQEYTNFQDTKCQVQKAHIEVRVTMYEVWKWRSTTALWRSWVNNDPLILPPNGLCGAKLGAITAELCYFAFCLYTAK
jgi:hypothetical protein